MIVYLYTHTHIYIHMHTYYGIYFIHYEIHTHTQLRLKRHSMQILIISNRVLVFAIIFPTKLLNTLHDMFEFHSQSQRWRSLQNVQGLGQPPVGLPQCLTIPILASRRASSSSISSSQLWTEFSVKSSTHGFLGDGGGLEDHHHPPQNLKNSYTFSKSFRFTLLPFGVYF